MQTQKNTNGKINANKAKAAQAPAPGKRDKRGDLIPAQPELLAPKKEKAPRVPQKMKLSAHLLKIAKITERRVAHLAGTPQQQELIEVVSRLKSIGLDVADFSDTWRRAGKDGQTRFAPVPGMIVALREKRREHYSALIDDVDHFDALKVVKVLGKKLVVSTPDGIRLVMPTSHFTAAKEV